MNASDLEKLFGESRNDFPMLKRCIREFPFIYLDSAATALKPKQVIDAISTFYAEHYATVHRGVYTTAAYASELYQQTRVKLKQFLNASSEDEIIFTRGTTDAINLVAASYGRAFVNRGDEVLVTEMEHHSNLVPWQMMCQERGAQLKVISFKDSGELDMEVFAKTISNKTKIIAVAHISNTLGTVNPIKEIVRQARAKGAKVLVDGAQSAPHVPIDVQDLNVDFFAFSGHKAVGPTGIGVLYGKKELLEALPPYQGGGDMIEKVTFEKTTYNVPPLKFEAGTPMIAEVIGLGAAIDYLNQLGMDNIARWENELLTFATHLLDQIPQIRILGRAPQKGAAIIFHAERAHPLDIATLLDLKGIAIRTGHLCAQPVMQHFNIESACRASFAFYNTKEEILFFAKTLKDVLQTLS